MEEDWRQAVRQWVEGHELLQATFSQPRTKAGEGPVRTVVRPVRLKNGLHYQLEHHRNNQASHENLAAEAAAVRIVELLTGHYRQALLKTGQSDVQLLISKKGKAAMLRKPPTASGKKTERLDHNRAKRRIVGEGEAVPFLVELGIMTPEGKVHAQKQDKYRQINRFLEMVSDVLDALPKDRPLRIVDFGCGKSYLTFALYHLLVVKHRLDVSIVGLDLKSDVIAFCSSLAEKLGYDGLTFLHGDIAEYEGLDRADMVVTLHACDTATDAALVKAVRWGASVILSVPCCQHELFGQISSDALKPLLDHGILKERFASLVTDAARAQLLEAIGYKVQLLEFIDIEHTPKNILIRAVRSSYGSRAGEAHQTSWNERKWGEYAIFRDALGLNPYLEREFAKLFPDFRP